MKSGQPRGLLLQTIPPKEFERFAAALLDLEGFTNVRWVGAAGSDKARDILADRVVEPIARQTETQHWIVQCKAFFSKRISKGELHELLVSAEEHRPDHVLLIYTGTLSANTQDWLTITSAKFSFRVYLWQAADLEDLIERHYSELAKRFGHYLKKTGKLWIYHVSPPDHHEFLCHEMEDVVIKVENISEFGRALKRVMEFIEHVKTDKIVVCRKPSSGYRGK